MAINKNTILDGVWQEIYNLLTDTGMITDTRGTKRTLRSDFIFSAFPEAGKTPSSFPGYPIVILHVPNISGGNFTLHKMRRNLECTVPIDIYDKSAKNCKIMADEVIDILNDNQRTLRKAGLGNFRIGSTDNVTDFINRQRIHRITILGQWDYQNT